MSGFGTFDDDETKITSLSEIRAQGNQDPVSHHAYLIFLAGSDIGRIYRLEEGETVIGRSRSAEVCFDDDSISRRHCVLRRTDEAVEIEDLESSNGTFVNGMRVTKLILQDGDKIRIGDSTILKFTFHDQLEENFQRQMYDAALRDGLTKAFNKRYCEDLLDKEIGYARRHGTPLSLLFLDLDYFKQVNDQHGHVTGDEVLEQLSALVQSMLRSEDTFARWGGEEFAIVVRGIALEQAGILAERLRAAVESMSFVCAGKTLKLTVSIGVAQYEKGFRTMRDFVSAADSALYAAKAAGRNQVLLKERSSAEDEGPPSAITSMRLHVEGEPEGESS